MTVDLTPPNVPLVLYGEQDDTVTIYRRSDGTVLSMAGWTAPRAYWRKERKSGTVVEFGASIVDNKIVVSITAAMKADLPLLGYWECRVLNDVGGKVVMAEGTCRFEREVSS